MRFDFGIDPDSSAHGVAMALDKRLMELKCMTLYEIMQMINSIPEGAEIHFHIEDVSKMKAVFKDKTAALRRTGGNEAKKTGEVARKIGMMQQSQEELVRFLKSMNRPINIRLYPISSAWKESKSGAVYMERVWGYKGRSNEDTRSAAYFLSLGCR